MNGVQYVGVAFCYYFLSSIECTFITKNIHRLHLSPFSLKLELMVYACFWPTRSMFCREWTSVPCSSTLYLNFVEATDFNLQLVGTRSAVRLIFEHESLFLDDGYTEIRVLLNLLNVRQNYQRCASFEFDEFVRKMFGSILPRRR